MPSDNLDAVGAGEVEGLGAAGQEQAAPPGADARALERAGQVRLVAEPCVLLEVVPERHMHA